MSELQEKFIILRKMKYGEADLIIHALSAAGAKKSFMARSALKSKKRFGGGVLEPTHYVQFTYKERKVDNQLNVLNEAVLIDDFQEIRQDYDKLELALFVLNCAYHVSQEGDADSHFLFNLVGHSLRKLGKTENIPRFKLHFCLKFLFQQGVISGEGWMSPFLKTNIADSEKLDEQPEMNEIIDTYLDSIESQVLHYIKNADTGF
ncbi:DNA repair protein RecO [Bdellovibrio sp. qaytius]|nr:DNA repair protein RecO [Bdellovibrio sp. qaytius]